MRGIKVFFAIVMFLVSLVCLILGITFFSDPETGNGAGIFCLIITGITLWLGVTAFKTRNIKTEPKSNPFPDRKIVLTSTPTIKGNSKIEEAYEDSTRERWMHKCPGCKEWSQFVWGRLDFETVKMGCPWDNEYVYSFYS
jgi:hypothetical protein